MISHCFEGAGRRWLSTYLWHWGLGSFRRTSSRSGSWQLAASRSSDLLTNNTTNTFSDMLMPHLAVDEWTCNHGPSKRGTRAVCSAGAFVTCCSVTLPSGSVQFSNQSSQCRRKRAKKCITVFVRRVHKCIEELCVVCWHFSTLVTCNRNQRNCEWCNKCCRKIKYAATSKREIEASLTLYTVLWGECDLTFFELCKNQPKRSLQRLGGGVRSWYFLEVCSQARELTISALHWRRRWPTTELVLPSVEGLSDSANKRLHIQHSKPSPFIANANRQSLSCVEDCTPFSWVLATIKKGVHNQ